MLAKREAGLIGRLPRHGRATLVVSQYSSSGRVRRYRIEDATLLPRKSIRYVGFFRENDAAALRRRCRQGATALRAAKSPAGRQGRIDDATSLRPPCKDIERAAEDGQKD